MILSTALLLLLIAAVVFGLYLLARVTMFTYLLLVTSAAENGELKRQIYFCMLLSSISVFAIYAIFFENPLDPWWRPALTWIGVTACLTVARLKSLVEE